MFENNYYNYYIYYFPVSVIAKNEGECSFILFFFIFFSQFYYILFSKTKVVHRMFILSSLFRGGCSFVVRDDFYHCLFSWSRSGFFFFCLILFCVSFSDFSSLCQLLYTFIDLIHSISLFDLTMDNNFQKWLKGKNKMRKQTKN